MKYFAEIDQNNIVKNVIVIDNEDINVLDYPESEVAGQLFIEQELKLGGSWLECSIDGLFRKIYPSPEFKYDVELDMFVSPQPFPSWTLNNESGEWVPPIPKPDGPFLWNEDQQEWVPLNI